LSVSYCVDEVESPEIQNIVILFQIIDRHPVAYLTGTGRL